MVRKKKLISGEILKEPLLDVLLTDLEQISFSLLCPRASWVTEGSPDREHPDSTAVTDDSARRITRNANNSGRAGSAFVPTQAKGEPGTQQKNGLLLGATRPDLPPT